MENKTKFVSVDDTQKEKKETVFTYYQSCNGWEDTTNKPIDFTKCVYLGRCSADGDMFACYQDSDNSIQIYKGTKGDEFQTN